MFGIEFAKKNKNSTFPSYDRTIAVNKDSVEIISPLVWQEHCVECAMPECYGQCVRYRKRIDGRCKLFKNGIERIKNKNAILGMNVTIDMDDWAKLETFFFTAGYSYGKGLMMNKIVVLLGEIAQGLRLGCLRRFCYYIKETFTRMLGDLNNRIPTYFLFELINNEEPFSINLENRADDKIVYRTSMSIKRGYNRFLIPSSDFNYVPGVRNYLSMYPDKNVPRLLNIISLELVSFKKEYKEMYIPKSEEKIKCVVWDLDNTLWRGILSEDGIDGIEINNNIFDIIKKLDQKGILNSISSKNYESEALEALEHFGLSDYFVCPMINWEQKSKNIKNIAKVLDIGIDTFAFVDDSFFELNEVKENCLGIRVCNVLDIEEFINGSAFDVPITEESRRRRKSYKEIAERNIAATEFSDNIIDFIKSCQMVIEIAKPGESEINRCYELVQRTNQLNISGERLSLQEVKELVDSNQNDCYRIKAMDRFGDYGLVGFAVFNKKTDKKMVLNHFVFSCRAARKMIEQSFFEYIIKKYYNAGYETLELVCKVTEKNKLMRQVLDESNLFEKESLSNDKYKLIHVMKYDNTNEKIMDIFER